MSNLTIAHMSLATTRKFPKTTRKLDPTTRMCLEELMTYDTHEKVYIARQITRVECLSE